MLKWITTVVLLLGIVSNASSAPGFACPTRLTDAKTTDLRMFHCYVGAEKLLDDGILDDTSHQAVYSDTEPGCRFETYDLIVTDIPVTAIAINVYNVLGQRVLQRSIRVQTTERVPFESASGLYFVELRDASKNVLAVIKAVKR